MDNLQLDTNVIIRFLTNDDNIQSPLAYKVFEKASQHAYNLILSPVVIVESTWVLQMKRYGYTKAEIADVLTKLIISPGIKMLDEKVILKALSDFSNYNVDFIDAYLSSMSILEENYPIVTWNKKDFNRLGCEFYLPENLL